MKLITKKTNPKNRLLPWVVFPAIAGIIAILFEYSGFDLWVISHFYDSQHLTWPYKNHWLYSSVIHSGGRMLDKFFGLIWLIAFFISVFNKKYHKYLKVLLFFFLSTISGPIIIGIGKSITHIYSPWDLLIYNGQQPYIRLFDYVPAGVPVGHAFPAGHASGGFCFLSLYFVFLRYSPGYRFHGLLSGLATGIIFGAGQQIRGAHFPSHDIFSFIICWYSCMIMFFIFYPDEMKLQKKISKPSDSSVIKSNTFLLCRF